MNILLTGGTGLIGSSLVSSLLSDHNITVLSRSPAKASLKLGAQVSVINDLGDIDFNTLDIIINLAGEPIVEKRWTAQQKKTIENSRWHITQQLVDHIKAASTPPHTFISGSAIGYYGRQGEGPVDETFTDCFSEFSHLLCKKWETIALEAHSPSTRVCIVRTGIVLSREGGALQKMTPAFKMGLGGPIATGEQMMSWIHIDDMIRLLHYLIQNDAISGPINATAPTPVSNEVFSVTLANTLNRPHFFRVPKSVLNLLMGEMSDLLVYGQNVIPKKIMKEGFIFKFPDIAMALNDLLKK